MSNSLYFDISERKVLLRLVDTMLYVLSLWIAFTFLNFEYLNFVNTEVYLWIITLIVYTLLFGEIFQLYDLNVSNDPFKVIKSVVLTTFVTTLFYFFTPYLTPSLPENRIQILYFFLVLTIPVYLWRILYMNLLYIPKYFKRVAIVGHSSRLENFLPTVSKNGFYSIAFYASETKNENYNQFISLKENSLKETILQSNITELIVSTSVFNETERKRINNEVIQLYGKGIKIKSFNDFYEELTQRIPENYLDDNIYKKISYNKNNDNNFYLFILRFVDIIISILGILIFILLFPLILIGNLIGNRGTIFYTQNRVGMKGRIFKMIKFRTMIKNAETEGAVWAKKNDSRITKFGKFLRNTRIDEIPQFINILKGDMSLIGPRPERPEFVKDLEEVIPFYAVRNIIRPGLPGWAQVNYPYANSIEEQKIKLQYDLYYIKERNLFLDFKIFIRTITTVLFFRGQ